MRQLQVEQQNAASAREHASQAGIRASAAERQLQKSSKAEGDLRSDVERWTAEAHGLEAQIGTLKERLSTSQDRVTGLQQEKEHLEGQVEALQKQVQASESAASTDKAVLQVRCHLGGLFSMW